MFLVHDRPVDANAVADQLPLGTLFCGRPQQPGKPLQRRGNFPPVGEQHEDGVCGEPDIAFNTATDETRIEHG